MKDEITVLIADDHPVFRRGLNMILASEKRLRIVAEAADGAEALTAIKEHEPDVAVLDVNMPALTGFEVVREMRRLNLATEVLFLTMNKDEAMFNTALDLGVNGYVLKESAIDDIAAGIKKVAAGRNFISPPLAAFLINRRRRAAAFVAARPGIHSLTATEQRVLKLIAEDQTSRAIGELLFISVRTVERHRLNICTKLEIRGSNGLLKFAVANKEQFI